MKIRAILPTLLLSLICSLAYSQTIQGYSFSAYKANVSTVKKAPLILKSHTLGKIFRTKITEEYQAGKIDFAGHYITILWGAGMGLTMGAMVDALTGKIYELPINEENSYRGTYHDENNNIIFKSNSNLFVCYSSANNQNNEDLVDLVYYFYKWNDTTKRFELLTNKSITTKRIDN